MSTRFLLITVSFCLVVAGASAQSARNTIPYTNGEVKVLANYGDTVFVGGQFSKVYSYEQSAKTIAYIDTLTGQHIPIKLTTNGVVQKIIRDETGTGFYLCGTFTTVGDSARSGLAHIDALGNITARLSGWKMKVPVYKDIVLRGDSLIAAGSYLSNIAPSNVSADSYLKGISTLTAANDHLTLPNVNGTISYMVVDGMGARYICGDFTRVGNQPRNKLAKIDSVGNVLPWEPKVSGQEVTTLFLRGNTILIGGRFEFVNGLLRRSVAEVDTTTGKNTTALFIDAMRNGNTCSVYSMDKWQNTILLSGDFTHIGDSARNSVAVIDTATGRPTSRVIDTDGGVYKVLVSGNLLYIGGSYATVNGISRRSVASINLSTGVLSSLAISAAALSGSDFVVNDLVMSGTTLYLGLLTFPVNSVIPAVAGVVAVNTGTGAIITQFSVPRDQQVSNLVLHQGVLYASGNFTQMAGNTRSGLASITVANNTLTGSFGSSTLTNKKVLGGSNNRILLSATSTDDYVQFNNNQRTTGLLVYHTTSDSMFTFTHQIIGQVNTLLLLNDTLFMGGAFTLYGRNRGADSTRNNFAAVRMSTYDVLAPSAGSVTGTVNALVKWNNTIILGGDFPAHTSGLLGVDLTTSAVAAYGRPYTGVVYQMCLANNQLYLGGAFTLSGSSIGLISTSPVAGGSTTTWNTDYIACKAISFYQNKLYTYGTYMANSTQLKQLRTFSVPSNPALPPTLLTSRSLNVPNGEVYAFEAAGNRIITAGTFEFLGGEINTNHFFAYQRSTGKVLLQQLSMNTDAYVASFARLGQTLYIGGFFDTINGMVRKNLASVNLVTGAVTSWNPGTNNAVSVVHITDSNLWVGGMFTTIAAQSRNGFAVIDLTTNTLRPGIAQPNAGRSVNLITSNATDVFVAGNFDSLGGVFVRTLASFNRNTLAFNTGWKPYANYTNTPAPVHLEAMRNNVYALTGNNQVLKINATTGLPDAAWSKLQYSGTYNSFVPYQSGLLLLGQSSYLIDTVQGNHTQVALSAATLSSVSPHVCKINKGIVVGDNVIYGGWFTDNTRNHLLEYPLTGNELLRMETSQPNMCKSRDFTIRLAGADTATPRTFVARLSGNFLGVLSVPSKMSLTFKVPLTFASGTTYNLTLESQSTKLETSRSIVVGDPPVKTIQAAGLLQLCVGQATTLMYTDSADRAVNTYRWYRNDTLVPSATQYIYSNIMLPGSYKSVLLTQASCLDTTATINITQTGLCQAPTVAAKNLRFKNVTTTAATLFWTKGNGARKVVLAKLDSAVTAGPAYGVTYTASEQFGLGDSLGFKNYVVYNGTQNECAVQGLIPGRKYHFAVIEYNETGTASSYQSGPYLIGSITIPSAVYYNKTTGNLQVLSTWGTNADGTGTAPTNFTTPAVFNVRTGTTPVLTGNWSLDTNGSVVSIGPGLSATPLQLTIPSGMAIVCGNVNVNGNAVLTVTGTLTTNFLNASDTSMVIYNGVGVPQSLCPAAVGRFTAQGALKLMNGNFRVSDTLRLDASVASTNTLDEDTFTLGTKFSPRGHLNRTSGTIAVPFNRWIQNAVASGTNGLLPIGSTGVRFIQLDIITPATDIGAILVTAHHLRGTPGNSGLPLTENGISLTTVGSNGYWKILNVENRQGLVFNQIATVENFPGVTQPLQTRLVTRAAGGNWQLYGPATVVSGTVSAFTLTKNAVSTFGEFAVGGNLPVNPLPVHWLAADAVLQYNDVLLSWQTGSEQNSERFDIERSLNNETYEQVGSVKATGTTTNVSNYAYTDANAAALFAQAATVYYRIKQVDVDGTYSYSKTLSVAAASQQSKTFVVYPNPSSTDITVSGATEAVLVYDLLGNQVMQLTGDGEQDISALQPGIYVIRSGKQVLKWVKY